MWPMADVDPGANEFSVQGIAHLPGEIGEVGILIIDGEEFMRGDVDQDERLDIGDSIAILLYLYLGASEPACLKAADMNDDSKIDVSDAIYGLQYRFLGGPQPLPPVTCAKDPSPDDLTCWMSKCVKP